MVVTVSRSVVVTSLISAVFKKVPKFVAGMIAVAAGLEKNTSHTKAKTAAAIIRYGNK
jgi:hypothetical protein